MNNSINQKNQLSKNKLSLNLDELSQTSSEFLSVINKKLSIMKGGSCECKKSLDAFNNDNIELALYIINENKCCCLCKDDNGDTILHHLIKCSSDNISCINSIDNILKKENIDEFINIQNNLGQTPMLLAVKYNNMELASKLDELGADKSIKDIDGNYIESDFEENKEIEKIQENKEIEENKLSSINNDIASKNNINIFNIKVIQPDLHDSDVSSLNIAESLINLKKSFNKKEKYTSDEYEIDNNIPEINKNKLSDVELDNNDLNNQETDIFMHNLMNEVNNESKDKSEDFKSIYKNNNETVNQEDYSDTDRFINVLMQKYKNEPINKENRGNRENTGIEDSTLKIDSSTSPIQSEILKQINEKQKLSKEDINKLGNEITSSENNIKDVMNIINDSSSTNNLVGGSSDIDSFTILNAINNINVDDKVDINLVGGKAKKNLKENVMGYRKLVIDSEEPESSVNKKYSKNINYDLLYSESENGKVSKTPKENELSRMMRNQREQLHEEVLAMIMKMLNEGLLLIKNKPIESNERNAKLVKAFIYRDISERNPQLSGMDKILIFKNLPEAEIIKIVKKMPNLDELEKNIQEHLKQKQKMKSETESESETISDTTEAEISNSDLKSKKKTSKKETPKKTSKKETPKKESKSSKKSSKKTSKK